MGPKIRGRESTTTKEEEKDPGLRWSFKVLSLLPNPPAYLASKATSLPLEASGLAVTLKKCSWIDIRVL
jgi:hypothetical protein